MSEEFKFAPERSWVGEWYTPAPVQLDGEPQKAKPAPVEDNTPFRFAPGTTRKSASGDPFGDDESEPAKRTEFHLYKNLQLDDEDEGTFRKSRTANYKTGDRLRWLKARKNFVVTSAVYTAKGLWVIAGAKDDGSGELRGIFHPSELAAVAA
jgi:hypothetical protein